MSSLALQDMICITIHKLSLILWSFVSPPFSEAYLNLSLSLSLSVSLFLLYSDSRAFWKVKVEWQRDTGWSLFRFRTPRLLCGTDYKTKSLSILSTLLSIQYSLSLSLISLQDLFFFASIKSTKHALSHSLFLINQQIFLLLKTKK